MIFQPESSPNLDALDKSPLEDYGASEEYRSQPIPSVTSRKRSIRNWGYYSILFYVLLAAIFFRIVGLFWGEYQYLHPDERFLVWVGTDISPVKNLGEYFDTANSSLNPHNRGHGFYVYGTLPMFITRYVVEGVFGNSGFMEMTQVGRALSALADVITVILVFMVAKRLYDKRVAVLAAAFSAATVLQIQQSHFFTMDTFITMFSFLAFYFAVQVAMTNSGSRKSNGVFHEQSKVEQDTPGFVPSPDTDATPPDLVSPIETRVIHFKQLLVRFFRDPLFMSSLGFGIALGMAVASKLNAAPMAFVLPAAMIVHIISLPPKERERKVIPIFCYLALAAVVSLLVFRICQPYAFSGPGFFGLKFNPQWLNNIREQRAQSGRNVDFPPAMQWARRPIWFSFQNMVLWGLGLPLGVLAWTGFLWVGWRLLHFWKDDQASGSRRIECRSHALIWGWTAIYFAWQSIQLNPTMRYQLPIYPTLAIFAGWVVIKLYDCRSLYQRGENQVSSHPSLPEESKISTCRWRRLPAVLIGGIVLLATYAYAFAFSQIYVRPVTRVEASRWIYQNIPGPIVLPIHTEQGVYNQTLPFPYDQTISPGVPYSYQFQPREAGTLSQVFFPHIRDEIADHQERSLTLSITSTADNTTPLATAILIDDLTSADSDSSDIAKSGKSFTLNLDNPVTLNLDETYILKLTLPDEEPPAMALDSEIVAFIDPDSGDLAGYPVTQTLQSVGTVIRPNTPLVLGIKPFATGMLTQLQLKDFTSQNGTSTLDKLLLQLQPLNESGLKYHSSLTSMIAPEKQGYLLVLDPPLSVIKDKDYQLNLEILPEGGNITLSGVNLANEGEWDDGLPLRMDGYDGFGGIYPLNLDFNMYWDDNPEKLERFIRILNEADYIAISSNRQWGTLPRLPERFPMTSIYYRNLLGCPPEYTIEYCYRTAEPGTFEGKLGYELVKVFTSDPRIGLLRLNDQFAEEAFTVYDHPKVFIFKKTETYDPYKTRAILSTVDFSHVIRVPPMQAPAHPENLQLPDERLAEQRQGGTWSKLFDTDAFYNRFQILGVLVWYLSVGLLGLIVYPLLRLALPGLADRGFPLTRIAGMLVLSYLAWLAGSYRVPFSRLNITVILALMASLGIYLAYQQREELVREWRTQRRYYLIVEGLTLAFFLVFLLVRIGNPDLWHPWKGGEKPMDFSYFNAVLKSTSFPPYDPWYAGGYLNYYYYGFVFVGTLVKWLGIVPSTAYNLILPTLFSMMAMGGFSIAWNLSQKAKACRATQAEPNSSTFDISQSKTYIPAVAGALGMAVLGNLGTVRMFFQGFQKLIAPGGIIEGANIITRWIWAIRGFVKVLMGTSLPYSVGDWYWNPSRVIPALGDVEPITEFPYFTLLYADPHAHLYALPITLLALALCVAIILGHARWKNAAGGIAWYLLTALAIGALRPTNTWDLPTYLVLGLLAVGYALWVNFHPSEAIKQAFPFLGNKTVDLIRFLFATGSMLLLAVLIFVLFQPYANWNVLGYTHIDLWKGARTPFSAYLTHWGLFLFLIVSWMIWETRDWMAKTPLSALRKLHPYRHHILMGLLILLITVVGLLWYGVPIVWFVLPIAAWAGILLFRPSQPDAKRIVLFLVGSGLVLTLMVEIIVLRGDIGRMNWVFKFYLQVWTIFSICAAASLGWLLPALPDWKLGWRSVWQVTLTILVAGAALYTMMATMAKIEDRMAIKAPHTLDGMAFMQFASYTDQWGTMDLSQDYRAIRWMQENVVGSPVIVEANLRDLYRWGSRYSIYTGLPGVVGWEWHQHQQRTSIPTSWVSGRIAEIDDFYLATDLQVVEDFLRKYDVRYIILGQQERGHYPGPGLDKFEDLEGLLWQEVYREGDTVIFEVLLQ
jgi:YYY domain-containing protein